MFLFLIFVYIYIYTHTQTHTHTHTHIAEWWFALAQLVETLRYKPEGRGFIGIFIDNFSGCTMALVSNQCLKKTSTRNISEGAKTTGA